MRVAQDQWAHEPTKSEILTAVRIDDRGTLGGADHERCAAHAAECTAPANSRRPA